MRFLDKHSGRDKQLRALEREASRLNQAQGHAPVIPLERPYHRGWDKCYILEERVASRADSAGFRVMLAEVNQRVYSRSRTFTDRSGRALVLRPRLIPERAWTKLGWPEKHRRYFGYGCWREEDPFGQPATWRPHVFGFKLVDLSWLREDVQPHLITHQRVELPEVRSRLAEIDAFMECSRGWRRLDRLHGRSHWWRRFESAARELRAASSLCDQFENHTPD